MRAGGRYRRFFNTMKKINLYTKEGYLNYSEIKELPYTFIMIVGGRGTGKTYGAIKYELESGAPFIYMRRLQTQADLAFNDLLSPFRPICDDIGMDDCKPFNIAKGVAGLYHTELDEKEKRVPSGSPLALLMALSTVSNVRGLGTLGYQTLILDEFIPQKQERPIKDEAGAFYNAYETFNRNRELQGLSPMKAILLSNANDLGNPYFMDLKIVNKVNSMVKRGQQIYTDDTKSLCVIMLGDSPLSKKKGETALYKLTAGGEFAEMALENKFSAEEVGRIAPRRIVEYKWIISVGEISIYRHKSREEFYVQPYKPMIGYECYGSGDLELTRFRRKYAYLWREYMRNNVIFEDYTCELLYRKYFGL